MVSVYFSSFDGVNTKMKASNIYGYEWKIYKRQKVLKLKIWTFLGRGLM